MPASDYTPPDYNCPLCPRLVEFRLSNRRNYPAFYNGPVPSFGTLDAELLVVGLAPGLKGANQTGRPFTGDYAGIILYSALKKYGFAEGEYNPEKVVTSRESRIASKTDGFKLINCRISNAVRCVPPENKPENMEIRECNTFLRAEISAMNNLKVIISLGQISHRAVISAFNLKQSHYKFSHGGVHNFTRVTRDSRLVLINTYHTSRYNINTGTLTQEMFDDIIATASGSLNPNKTYAAV